MKRKSKRKAGSKRKTNLLCFRTVDKIIFFDLDRHSFGINTEAEDSILSRTITQSDLEFIEQVFNSYLDDLRANGFSQIYPLAKWNLQQTLASMP